MLLYLTYGLERATYSEGTFTPPAQPGDLVLLSPNALDDGLDDLRDLLGASPRLAVTGPFLPGTNTPSFLAYEVVGPSLHALSSPWGPFAREDRCHLKLPHRRRTWALIASELGGFSSRPRVWSISWMRVFSRRPED